MGLAPCEERGLLQVGVGFDLVYGWGDLGAVGVYLCQLCLSLSLSRIALELDFVASNLYSGQLDLQRQNLLDPLPRKVTHANTAHLPGLDEALERLPCLLDGHVVERDQVRVGLGGEDVGRGDEADGPVDQVQVYVGELQVGEGLGERLFDVGGAVRVVPEFGGYLGWEC